MLTLPCFLLEGRLEGTKFCSQLYRKGKTWYFPGFFKLSVSRIERGNSDLTPFTSKTILQSRIDERWDLMKMNSEFERKKWISQTVRALEVDETNELICLVSFFPSWVMVFKFSKTVLFCKFVLTSAKNLNLLKQFIYIHLKHFIMLFQKTVCFIGVWATVHEVLMNKIAKKELTQEKFNNIHQFQTLVSSEF